jgi:hypothetical protein
VSNRINESYANNDKLMKTKRQFKLLQRLINAILLTFLWLFFLFILWSYIVIQADWTLTNLNSGLKSYDFKIFYQGILDHFAGGSMYKSAAELPFERIDNRNGISPAGALLFLPLTALLPPIAAFVWNITCFTLYLFGILLIWKVYGASLPKLLHWRFGLFVLLFVGYPVFETLQLGTWGLLIASLNFATWYFGRKNDHKLSGLFLGLAVSLRWQPAPLVLFFLIRKRWTTVVVTLGVFTATALLALFVFGSRNYVDFISLILTYTNESFAHPANGSLKGVIETAFLFLPHDTFFNFLSTFLWLGGVIFLTGLTYWLTSRVSYDNGFCLWMICGLLLVNPSWMHYHTLIAS